MQEDGEKKIKGPYKIMHFTTSKNRIIIIQTSKKLSFNTIYYFL